MGSNDNYFSVNVPNDNVGCVDADEYGSPFFYLNRALTDWADMKDIDLDYSFDDLGNIWFYFPDRGMAMLFLLEWS